ncbi:cupredoxin family copper-binding protein [Candidatus Woesearchaeota archaeon]|nr:cupredoxin family copper-binding protein [Candidatus Woesearchaeota archaeon]
MKKLIAFVLLLTLIACAAPQQQRGDTSARTVEPTGNVVDVTIEGFAFNPTELTVNAGDTVRWTNKDSVTHTATGQGFDTGPLNPGQNGEVTFDKPGTYTYKCTPHPSMKGKIIVN